MNILLKFWSRIPVIMSMRIGCFIYSVLAYGPKLETMQMKKADKKQDC